MADQDQRNAQAVAAVAATDFNVVLMDVRMPEMDGLEATRRIRALEGSRGQVPIVALTAQAFTEQVAECRKAGMDGHLAKPFDPDQLLSAILLAAAAEHLHRESLSPVSIPTILHTAHVTPMIESELQILDPTAFELTARFLSPEMVDSYLQTIADSAEALLRRLRTPDILPLTGDQLGAAAHTLAGSAGMFGFERLAGLSRRFERALESGAVEVPVLAAGLRVRLESQAQRASRRVSSMTQAA
jgi:CheY-like chemotaxis protein/HPt (histidine-containing phosphotransfer) domain-containing protein